MKNVDTAWMSSALLFAVLASLPHLLAAQEPWPQFRGPTGQGTSSAEGLPTSWSETDNIKWKIAIPGKGHSSPVIMGNEIWLTTALETGRSRNVLTLDYKTGRIVRNKTLYSVDSPERCHGHNSYATPTPVIEDDRVYVTFGAPGTACLSRETGEVIWRRTDFSTTYKEVGAASSPAIHENMLIMICDGERTSERFVVALDKMTGKTLWRTDRIYGDGRLPTHTHAFSVPLVITVRGEEQIICPGAHRVCAYEPETGKEVWYARYDGWSVVPRPVYGGNKLYVCCGVVKPMMLCINPEEARGDISETDRVVWKTAKKVPPMPSPLFVDNRLYTLTANSLACRKPETGEVVWNASIPGQHLASPVCADGHIYLFNKSGGCTVVKAADSFQMVGANKLESGCMASPAIYGNSLIVRTVTHLYRIEE